MNSLMRNKVATTKLITTNPIKIDTSGSMFQNSQAIVLNSNTDIVVIQHPITKRTRGNKSSSFILLVSPLVDMIII